MGVWCVCVLLCVCEDVPVHVSVQSSLKVKIKCMRVPKRILNCLGVLAHVISQIALHVEVHKRMRCGNMSVSKSVRLFLVHEAEPNVGPSGNRVGDMAAVRQSN